jgi:phage terminase small subunit
MNQRQIAFCEAYLVSGNAAQAARTAGYSEKTARSTGQRLLTFADIRKYLEQRNEEIKKDNTADIGEIREFWSSAMRNEGEKMKDRIRASELLAKTYGAFIDRLETTDTQSIRDAMKDLTEEELRQLAHLDEDISEGEEE